MYNTDPITQATYEFNSIILRWQFDATTGNVVTRESLALPTLPARTPTLETYYDNFIPLILEECKAILCQGLELVRLNKAPHLNLIVQEFKPSKNEKNPARFKMRGHLPKDSDQGTAFILLLLKFGSSSILALADYFDNYFAIKTSLPVDFSSVAMDNPLAIGTRWEGFILGSLINCSRMYTVCKIKPHFHFAQEVIMGEPLPPPSKPPACDEKSSYLVELLSKFSRLILPESISPASSVSTPATTPASVPISEDNLNQISISRFQNILNNPNTN
jgi:hypothetical protein